MLVGFLLFWTALLHGCGYQLRGEAQLPFTKAHVQASDASVLAPLLRQTLADQGKLAAQAHDAPVRIRIMGEQRQKDILSLSGGGKVREYRLIYKVTLRVTDPGGSEMIAPIELEQVREFTYDDALVLAKEIEEASLRQAMEQETLRQALRRLSYVKR
jgi:LPS-assembly lipoprotein